MKYGVAVWFQCTYNIVMYKIIPKSYKKRVLHQNHLIKKNYCIFKENTNRARAPKVHEIKIFKFGSCIQKTIYAAYGLLFHRPQKLKCKW